MSENQIDERIRSRVESPIRRFTVEGLKRVPRAYVPTLAIGAIVVIVATVVFVIDILGK
jgi:hypothetical protein